jgi:hypothetical protein
VRWALRLVVLGAVVLVGLRSTASAQTSEGPTITVDRADASPGDNVVVQLSGWKTHTVTVSVCGNAAARGSGDCNMVASEGIGLLRDKDISTRDFVVTAPPTPCPCVLRASSATNDEVAVAPMELIGHPVGPIVGSPAREPVRVAVSARRAPDGLVAALRAGLGGATPYEVTVTVENVSTQPVSSLALGGSATLRGDRDVTELSLPATGEIGPGETWRHTVAAELPAPVIGEVTWQVTASGAGAPVTAEESTNSLPVLLVVLILVFVMDMFAIAWRRLSQHRSNRGDAIAVPAATLSSP